jgi:hypothetical protein
MNGQGFHAQRHAGDVKSARETEENPLHSRLIHVAAQ